MEAMKPFIWDINSDLILLTDSYNVADPDSEYITGEAHQTDGGWKVVLHQDNLTAPANIDYFVKLWNATNPEKIITNADVLISDKLVTAASRIIVPKTKIERLDYDQFPQFADYMNSPGHINPEEDPETMKMRNRFIGQLGEMIIRHGEIPGLESVEDPDHDVYVDKHPIDALFNYDVGNGKEPFAAEIKASSGHNLRPYKYIITGYGAKSSKKAIADKMSHQSIWDKYSPATVGITMRYDDNAIDAYILPHSISSFSKSAKGAIPLFEDMPFDFNGFHPDPYHQARAPEKRKHGVDWRQKYEESPSPEDIF